MRALLMLLFLCAVLVPTAIAQDVAVYLGQDEEDISVNVIRLPIIKTIPDIIIVWT